MIALSFADVKETTYQDTWKKMHEIITDLYNQFDFLAGSEKLNETRRLFNAAFKANPYLERTIMTGITRVSKSLLSGLNNLEVVTTTSKKYADCFGFTEEEVFAVLGEYVLADKKCQVKEWYNGFTFGNRQDIYNPWSIFNFLN